MASPRAGGHLVFGRPFAFLAAWFALSAAQLLLNVLRPPLPTTNTRSLSVLALGAVVLAVATLLIGTLWPTDGGLIALLVAAQCILGLVVLAAAGGQGQFMAAFYLLVLDLIAALSLRRQGMWAVLVVGLTIYVTTVTIHPLFDSPGYAVFVVVVISLVTLVISYLVNSLRDQARHDQLTGALNRHGLEAAASLAHGLADREGRETTIVEIDLDGFKGYNDAFGHAAGDHLLADLVADWQSVLRRTDLLARVGGDEFVLVLPGATVVEAEETVTRLRGANRTPWTAGISAWRSDESLSAAFHRADAVMYDGKHNRPGGQAH